MSKKLFGWLGFGSNILDSVGNVISTALTNKSNQRIEAARNAMQIAENEKAYQRSKPTNQVANLQAAGMSKAGALNTLSGGGSYTPATISSSTNQAPQIDLSSAFDGLIQIGENAKQRKLQEESLDKQIQAAKEAQQAQFEENEKQRDHELEVQNREHNNTNTNLDKRLEWEKEMYDRLPKYDQERYDLALDLLRTQVDIEETKLDDLKYRVLEYQSLPYKTTRDSLNFIQGLAADLDINITKKEMKEFRDTYMYYDPNIKEWKLVDPGNNPVSNWLYDKMPLAWDFIARVIPANKLGDVIGRALAGLK